MPVQDPQSGRLFVWATTCFLFICIALGGCFLLLYLLSPQTPSWLPVAGVFLVCLPWLFWFLTCFYRIVSRAFGFRFAIGFDGGGGGGGGGSRARSTSFNAAENVSNDIETTDGDLGLGDGKQTQFGGGAVMQNETNANRRSLTASNSSNDVSVRSHESEMPLASSMAA